MTNIRILLILALLVVAPGARAVEFLDIDFPDRVRLQGSHSDLQLNGIGYRSKFFFKIYIGALYLAEKSGSPQIILEQNTPRRILMHFLYEEVEREKLVEGWNEGFASNNDAAALEKLADRIRQFNDYFPTLREGDEVMLDYVPRRGTRIVIKGSEVGVIEGKDFADALLRIWLGDEPADEGLKDAMLGL